MKVIFIMLLFLSVNALGGIALETNQFVDINRKVKELSKKYGPESVLIVLDIDNTVLKMKSNIGSDQWFNWQTKNCFKKSAPKYCVGDKFSDLLHVQGILFEILPMEATEPNNPKIVNKWQKSGHPLFFLTSRGPNYRAATERELKTAGYKSSTPIGPLKGYPGSYLAYDLQSFNKYNLTQKDIELSRITSKSRKVSYMNGVMMTSGENKGIMLKTILHKTNDHPKAIVFVDDHKKHTLRVQSIMGNIKGIELVTFRYGAVDKVVEDFNKSNKANVINEFALLNKAIKNLIK